VPRVIDARERTSPNLSQLSHRGTPRTATALPLTLPPRTPRRYCSFVAATALAAWALLDVCFLSVPPLTLAMCLFVSPLPHARFPRLAPLALFYALAWALVVYVYAAVPKGLGLDAHSMPASLLAVAGLDLAGNVGLVRTDSEVLAVLLQMVPVGLLAALIRLTRTTPTTAEMAAATALASLHSHANAAAAGTAVADQGFIA
jgi:hypothetical protein